MLVTCPVTLGNMRLKISFTSMAALSILNWRFHLGLHVIALLSLSILGMLKMPSRAVMAIIWMAVAWGLSLHMVVEDSLQVIVVVATVVVAAAMVVEVVVVDQLGLASHDTLNSELLYVGSHHLLHGKIWRIICGKLVMCALLRWLETVMELMVLSTTPIMMTWSMQ